MHNELKTTPTGQMHTGSYPFVMTTTASPAHISDSGDDLAVSEATLSAEARIMLTALRSKVGTCITDFNARLNRHSMSKPECIHAANELIRSGFARKDRASSRFGHGSTETWYWLTGAGAELKDRLVPGAGNAGPMLLTLT